MLNRAGQLLNLFQNDFAIGGFHFRCFQRKGFAHARFIIFKQGFHSQVGQVNTLSLNLAKVIGLKAGAKEWFSWCSPVKENKILPGNHCRI